MAGGLRLVVAGLVTLAVATPAAAAAPSCSADSCADCIQLPSCVWCATTNITRKKQCHSKSSASYEEFDKQCKDNSAYIVDPSFYREIKQNDDLSVESSQEDTIVIVKPQHVALELRVGDRHAETVTYRHIRNYPVDLYYLMDGSKSMSQIKDSLTNLGQTLVQSMKNITTNFRVGFGVFVDKPVTPFINTNPKVAREAFSYRNVLQLTDNADDFVKGVKETNLTSNLDTPEGSFDALMQAMVCEKEIGWRQQSLRIIVVSTDAGFHIAGDGRLAGITKKNDKQCHLDDSLYTFYDQQDYPSVGEIRHVMDNQQFQVMFTVTGSQEPLYRQLTDLLPRTSVSVLNVESSNIVDILTIAVQETISKVTMTYEVNTNKDKISVKIESNCKDNLPTCTNLEPGDHKNFTVIVTVKSCPENKNNWNNTRITVYPEGRSKEKDDFIIDLKMLCACNCDEAGDQGFLEDANQCNNKGNLACGKCDCHQGYLGETCECHSNTTTTLDDSACRKTNTSSVCSDQGQCICGKCECYDTVEFYGDFCECNNKKCTVDGKVCSGHGICDCDSCICDQGNTGKFCECSLSQDNCMAENGEICSGNGECKCNKCKCTGEYSGRLCNDCPTCTGKCVEYKACVQCQVFQAGNYTQEECTKECTPFTITAVENLEESAGKLCTFKDEENCIFYFKYEGNNMWVQEKRECPITVNIYWVIGIILGAVVLVGLGLLIAWKVVTHIKDQREWQRFELAKNNAKWVDHISPIYKPATTVVANPLFGKKYE